MNLPSKNLSVTLAVLVALGLLNEEIAKSASQKLGKQIVPPHFDDILKEIRGALKK